MHLRPGVAEEDIILYCKKGSLKHQEMLYKLFYGYAMGISLRYSLNRDDALEVTNDAFIKVFNNINSYNNTKPFKAWLRAVIINTAIDRRRKDLKHQQHADLEDAVGVSSNVTAVDSLNVQDILKIMEQLPPVQLTIFNLYEIDGYSHDEIAQMLSLSASSSRVYLTRAKEKLRSIINKQEQSHG